VRFKRDAGAGDETQFTFGATAPGSPGNYTFVIGIRDSNAQNKSANRVVQVTAPGQPAPTTTQATTKPTPTTARQTHSTSATTQPTAAVGSPGATSTTSATGSSHRSGTDHSHAGVTETSTADETEVAGGDGTLETQSEPNNTSRVALGVLLVGAGVTITLAALRRRPD
jgi:hypothetical protein